MHLSADGIWRGDAHREHSFLIWDNLEAMRSLAERVEQTAFHRCEETPCWLIATRGVPGPIRLPPEP